MKAFVLLACALAVTGCGDAVLAGGATTTASSSASCVGLFPGAQYAGARTVFVGTMLPGPTAPVGDQQVLSSPAQVQVSRYLKGSGPATVSVQTAVSGQVVSSDGIEPKAGQQWEIYSNSVRSPFQTSDCAGSAPMTGTAVSGAPGPFVTTGMPGPRYVTAPGPVRIINRLVLRSSATGRRLVTLASFGPSLTGNGLALTPDASVAFVTLVSHRSLLIEQVTVATRRRRVIARGEQPAVSPDGRQLAYAAGGFGSDALSIRSLASGHTSTIDLRHLLGRRTGLLDGAVTWLAGSRDVIATPRPFAIADSASRARVRPARPQSGCSAVPITATCLIVVHEGARRLSARMVVAHDIPGQFVTIAGTPHLPDSLLIAYSTARHTFVDELGLQGSSARLQDQLLRLPPVFPLAIDAASGALLYLVGHSPPVMWIGEIEPGHLIGRHRFGPDNGLQAVAWSG